MTTSAEQFAPTHLGLKEQELFSTLAYLDDTPMFVRRASESIDIKNEELIRNAQLTMTIPDGTSALTGIDDRNAWHSDPAGGNFHFYFVALRPRKRVLVSVTEPELIDGNPVQRLSHDDHIGVSRMLILTRFVYVASRAITKAIKKRDAGRIRDCDEALTLLTSLPAAPAKEARNILGKVFDDAGNLICLKGARLDSSAEAQLYHLCLELAERYYVIFRFGCSVSSMVNVRYGYRQHFYEHKRRRRDGWKNYLGAEPTAFRIHAPLARLADHYDLKMAAPPGYYFYEQRILEEVPADQSADNERGFTAAIPFLGRKTSSRFENVPTDGSAGSVMVTREIGGGTYAHIFVSNGRIRKRRLSIGLKLFELPPGTTGIAALFLFIGILVELLMLKLVAVYGFLGTHSDIPALVVALAAFIPTITHTILPRVNVVSMPIMPRVYLVAQSIGLLVFSTWLLAHGSQLPSGPNGIWKWWSSHGGYLITGLLCLLFAHSFYRVVRMIRAYQRVVRSGTTIAD